MLVRIISIQDFWPCAQAEPWSRTIGEHPIHGPDLTLFLRPRDRRVNAGPLALARGVLELHVAVDQREQGVVAAHPDVDAGPHDRAALANDDAAGPQELAVANLQAEPLSGTIPP